LEALGINAGNLFVNLISFGIAFILLAHFVVGPIRKMMAKRSAVIETGLKDAQIAAEAKANAQAEAEKILQEARTQGEAILKEAQDNLSEMKSEYREELEQEAREKLSVLQDQLRKEHEHTLGNLRNQVVDIAMHGAMKLVDASILVDESKQHAILNEFLSGLKEGKIANVSLLPENQSRLEVTTAVPLTAEEEELVRSQLSGKLAEGSDGIQFRIDPRIVGGMVIRGDEQLIDGSVLEKARNLKKALTQ